jgi:NADH dehydrogenase FAD-containing subunit
MWTLVGGGMKSLKDSGRPMKNVLPKDVNWIKDKVTEFRPHKNEISVGSKDVIGYDYLVVAAGIQLHYEQVDFY